jgi:hypothetical protein
VINICYFWLLLSQEESKTIDDDKAKDRKGRKGACATYRVKSTSGAKLFPTDVSGLFVYLSVPSVSKREFHPFSLCSGNKKGVAEVIVRSHGVGSWTGKVLLEGASRVGPIPAYCSGTYGSIPHLDSNSNVAVFVAGTFCFLLLLF